jgi:AraC-like DNA-binding protein
MWVQDQNDSVAIVGSPREHVLPTGSMHLVFRLSDHPLRVFEYDDDACGTNIGYAIVGGARAKYYVREISNGVQSVGVQFQPGGADTLFGVSADELAGRHTPLDELWGNFALEIRERLLAAVGPTLRLDLFETLLYQRLPRVHGMHPAVAQALQRLTPTSSVKEIVKENGYSHRRFVELFRRAVGLTPKLYTRILRFQAILDRLSTKPNSGPMVELALDAGYSDQSHFNREFREFAGVSPGDYLTAAPSFGNHVPVDKSKR